MATKIKQLNISHDNPGWRRIDGRLAPDKPAEEIIVSDGLAQVMVAKGQAEIIQEGLPEPEGLSEAERYARMTGKEKEASRLARWPGI
jgi:hypothetical protein